MGFTIVNTCYPMSVAAGAEGLNPVYRATSEEDIVCYNPVEKATVFRALADTIPEFRGEVRVFSPLSSLVALARQYELAAESPYACRGGVDYFFVNSKDGEVYPCGYRGGEVIAKPWERDGRTPRGEGCQRCDWECFRDPSELCGPMLEAFSAPWRLFQRWRRDREYFRLWQEDLRYHLACGLFDGRKPPRLSRLRRFARPVA